MNRSAIGHCSGLRKPRFSLVLALWACLVASPASALPCPAPPAQPWQIDDLAGAWRVTALDCSPEFLRVSVRRDDVNTAVEVVRDDRGAGEWQVGPYRLQPPPQVAGNEEAIAAVREALRTWHTAAAHPPFVQARVAHEPIHAPPAMPTIARAPDNLTESQRAFQRRERLIGAIPAPLHALLQLCGIVLLLDTARRRRDLRIPLLAGLGAIAVGTTLMVCFVPIASVPVHWFTALQEGSTSQAINTLHNQGAHLDEGLTSVVKLLATQPADVRSVLWLNLLLAGWFVVGATVCAWWITKDRLRTALTLLAFVGNLAVLQAALSELPSLLIAAVMWPGLLAFAAWREPGLRPLRWFTLLLATGMLAASRPELLLLGAALPLEYGSRPWLARLQPRAAVLLAWPPWVWLTLVVVVEVVLFAVSTQVPPTIHWFLSALDPFNPAFLTLPLMVSATAPLGAVLLLVAGAWAWVRQPGPKRAWVVTVAILYKMYFTASHAAWYELLRYSTYLFVPLLLIGAAGWAQLDTWLSGQARRPLWAGLIAVTFVVWLPHGNLAHFASNARVLDWANNQATDQPALAIRGDTQREVLFLQEVVDRHPQCALVTRHDVTSRREPEVAVRWVTFGRAMGAPREIPVAQQSLAALMAGDLARFPCVLYVRGLSCNLANGDPCGADYAGLTPLTARRFRSQTYSDFIEFGETTPEVEFATYRLR